MVLPALLMATATLGVDYGWQPTPEGQVEYIIQIEPDLLRTLTDGQQITSEIPPELRGVRRFTIRVGTGPVPRQLPPGGLPQHNVAMLHQDDIVVPPELGGLASPAMPAPSPATARPNELTPRVADTRSAIEQPSVLRKKDGEIQGPSLNDRFQNPSTSQWNRTANDLGVGLTDSRAAQDLENAGAHLGSARDQLNAAAGRFGGSSQEFSQPPLSRTVQQAESALRGARDDFQAAGDDLRAAAKRFSSGEVRDDLAEAARSAVGQQVRGAAENAHEAANRFAAPLIDPRGAPPELPRAMQGGTATRNESRQFSDARFQGDLQPPTQNHTSGHLSDEQNPLRDRFGYASPSSGQPEASQGSRFSQPRTPAMARPGESRFGAPNGLPDASPHPDTFSPDRRAEPIQSTSFEKSDGNTLQSGGQSGQVSGVSTMKPAVNKEDIPAPEYRPWTALTFSLLALFASIGGNVYLGMFAWETHRKFRGAVRDFDRRVYLDERDTGRSGPSETRSGRVGAEWGPHGPSSNAW